MGFRCGRPVGGRSHSHPRKKHAENTDTIWKMPDPGYVHPRHRSLHGPLMMLAVFSLCISSWSLFFGSAEAVNTQADSQCPGGGVVGQPCKDHTNGYTTSGHCTHIQICAADSWPKAPKGCGAGQTAGKDCPYGKNYRDGGNPMPRPIQISTSSIFDTPASGVGSADIFGASFTGDSGDTGYTPSQDQKVVGTTSVAGIQYLVTDNNEQLKVGEPLSPAPPPPPQLELHLGSIYSLGPVQPRQEGGNGTHTQRGYTGTYSFSGAPPSGGGSSSGDVSGGGGTFIGNILNSLASLFGGQRPADELVVVSTAQPAMIVPDVSMYYRAQELSSPQLLDVNWDGLLNTRRTIMRERPSIAFLVGDALSHTVHIGIDLLTADLTAAHGDLSRALSSTGQAFQEIGNSLSSSIRGLFSR